MMIFKLTKVGRYIDPSTNRPVVETERYDKVLIRVSNLHVTDQSQSQSREFTLVVGGKIPFAIDQHIG